MSRETWCELVWSFGQLFCNVAGQTRQTEVQQHAVSPLFLLTILIIPGWPWFLGPLVQQSPHYQP